MYPGVAFCITGLTKDERTINRGTASGRVSALNMTEDFPSVQCGFELQADTGCVKDRVSSG